MFLDLPPTLETEWRFESEYLRFRDEKELRIWLEGSAHFFKELDVYCSQAGLIARKPRVLLEVGLLISTIPSA